MVLPLQFTVTRQKIASDFHSILRGARWGSNAIATMTVIMHNFLGASISQTKDFTFDAHLHGQKNIC